MVARKQQKPSISLLMICYYFVLTLLSLYVAIYLIAEYHEVIIAYVSSYLSSIDWEGKLDEIRHVDIMTVYLLVYIYRPAVRLVVNLYVLPIIYIVEIYNRLGKSIQLLLTCLVVGYVCVVLAYPSLSAFFIATSHTGVLTISWYLILYNSMLLLCGVLVRVRWYILITTKYIDLGRYRRFFNLSMLLVCYIGYNEVSMEWVLPCIAYSIRLVEAYILVYLLGRGRGRGRKG